VHLACLLHTAGFLLRSCCVPCPEAASCPCLLQVKASGVMHKVDDLYWGKGCGL
jgi:hypothetical protein